MDGSVAAERIERLDFHQAAPPDVSWPVLVGQVPALASAFQARSGLRELVDAARAEGGVVLTQVLSGGGGVGKSQLAASYAREAVAAGTDLVVWVDASTAGAVIEVFARAAARVQVPGVTGTDAEADAREFLAWAAATSRWWLVVLDDVTDPGELAGWWPASHGGTGWVLATTRRRDAALTGAGRTLIDVGVYTPAESLDYLTGRLSGAGQAGLLGTGQAAGELARELGYLPLALSHAAAYLIDQQVTSAAYLDRYRAGRDRLDELMPASADADGYGRTIAATLLMALDAASTCDPAGLARPAIRLAALLGPAGHPIALWETSSVTRYLSRHRDSGAHPARYRPRRWVRPGKRVTAAQAREAVLLLHRYGLATFDDQAGPRAVRIHALTARAARETTATQQAQGIAVAAADALTAAWPDPDNTDPALADALRASTIFLCGYAIDSLWHRGRVDVLYKAGESLSNAGMYGAAITYWQRLITDLARIRSSRNGDLAIIVARANLAASYRDAGRAAEAITIDEQVVASLTRLQGPRDSGTLSARWNLALSYHQAGRTADAVTIDEQTAASLTRARGSDHSSTLSARADLAFTYVQAGRIADAIIIGEQAAAGLTRILGPDHPDTLAARAGLAAAYLQAGRIADAITINEQVVAGMARTLGPDHFDSLCARVFLAHSYWDDGRTAEAIAIFEQDVAGLARTRGPDHPDTLSARRGLALHYRQAGRTAEAIAIYEQAAADMARTRGPDHPDTLNVQAGLAASYVEAGRTADAIAIGEQVTADMARTLGPDDPDTLNARASLAYSYAEAGRPADAITIYEQVTADMARTLGPDHPDTLTARAKLASPYRQAGRTAEAIAIGEQAAAGIGRALGPDHPRTLNAQAGLAASYAEAGRTADAIAIGDQAAADMARTLGPDHPRTLNARGKLAFAYRRAGRTAEAITIGDQTAADMARTLGPDHPDTVAAFSTLKEWRNRP